MQYEFAPLEGITGYIYRNAHHACFPSMDRYYTPFITPKKGKSFTTREWNDIAAEHNQNIAVVPQILTNQAEGFCKVAGMLKEQGYEEVNLNLGCPSATVTAKKKGAGFLADPDALDAFLEEIFAHSPLKISIKTRIGVETPDEFERLLDIFSQYPIQKLIVHPRVLKEFYKGNVHREAYVRAKERLSAAAADVETVGWTIPVCYNGDLFSVSDTERFLVEYPDVDDLMFGRGMLIDPALVMRLRARSADMAEASSAKQLRAKCADPVEENAERLRARGTGNAAKRVSDIRDFYARLAEDYAAVLSGERDVLFKMKELWGWQGQLFEGSEKYLKKIRKAQKMTEYKSAVVALFADCPIKDA